MSGYEEAVELVVQVVSSAALIGGSLGLLLAFFEKR